MAVYERTYKRYTGPLTPQRSRFLVLPRYAMKDVFRSRIFTAFYACCFIYPLFACGWIYLANNMDFLAIFPGAEEFLEENLRIDGGFFQIFMNVQAWLAFVVALFVGPGLVSRDLANNGLPLYLSRPFSRAEYVLGKMTVLAIMLSAITWMAGAFLYILQSNFEGWGWAIENSRLAIGVFVGSWLWILSVSLLALALSAWVKWRPVAAFMMLATVLAGIFFGGIASELFKVDWPHMFNLPVALNSLWVWLFDLRPSDLSPAAAGVSLLGLALVSLFLLHRKIRAYEVVS